MLYAITGSIGSGKSACLDILKKLNYITINVDEINAELLTDKLYLSKLRTLFPDCFNELVLDKKLLRNVISANEERRHNLNCLAHGEIKRILMQKLTSLSTIDKDVFVEVPLLVESGFEDMFDIILNITASREICIKRAKERDNSSTEDIAKLYDSQASLEDRAKIATITIDNSGSNEQLKNNILAALHINN